MATALPFPSNTPVQPLAEPRPTQKGHLPLAQGRSSSPKGLMPTRWTLPSTLNGKVVRTTHTVLSADGKTITQTAKYLDDKGGPSTGVLILKPSIEAPSILFWWQLSRNNRAVVCSRCTCCSGLFFYFPSFSISHPPKNASNTSSVRPWSAWHRQPAAVQFLRICLCQAGLKPGAS